MRDLTAADPVKTEVIDLTKHGSDGDHTQKRAARHCMKRSGKRREAMSEKELKTNAMRILDRLGIPYEYRIYDCEQFTDGISTADQLHLPHEQVYKTLVTQARSGGYYVFVIPIEEEIDLKKAARAAGEKSLEMIPVRTLTTVTGYVRGGCTAIGMKKQFPTIIQEDASKLTKMYVSGGKLGMQLKLAPEDFKIAAKASYADVIKKCGKVADCSCNPRFNNVK